MKPLTALTCAAALCLCATPALAADLQVQVSGVADSRGQVFVALYGKDDPWMRKARAARGVDAAQGVTTITFSDLPEGEYAVSAFHDEDGDRRLSRNAVGLPTEPWGFSNDAMGAFGPPTFEQAKVALPPSGAVIVVKLRS